MTRIEQDVISGLVGFLAAIVWAWFRSRGDRLQQRRRQNRERNRVIEATARYLGRKPALRNGASVNPGGQALYEKDGEADT